MNTTLNHEMRKSVFRSAIVFALSCLASAGSFAQAPQSAIHLMKQGESELQMKSLPESEQALLARAPENFHHFGLGKAGETASPQMLTLTFAAPTNIASIRSTPDFKIVGGGSCEENRRYEANSSCALFVQFTPKGAGHRLGKITISDGNGTQPVSLVVAGFAQVAVVAFTPGLITTVAATKSGSQGLISGATNLAIDGGDNLYIADSGNHAVRYIDSSGAMVSISGGGTTPLGVAVDAFGQVFFTDHDANALYQILDYGVQFKISGPGTDVCTINAMCSITSEQVYSPGAISSDGSSNMFFADKSYGAVWMIPQPYPPKIARVYDPYTYPTSTPAAFAVDRSDNLYTAWLYNSCIITRQTFNDAANLLAIYTKVAGGRVCGYSGDGGQANGAEIGSAIGEIVFDPEGNLYFTDTNNNRVRRVDAYSGIIRTIAGNGSTGYAGDNGPSTIAALGAPVGVTVDSQGQVYILTPTDSTGTAQAVRKVGPSGALTFNRTVQGVASSTLLLNIANTGYIALHINRVSITGSNASDFTIDDNSTNCDFNAGNYLSPGLNCQIGVIFKPSAVGSRSATLTLVDNSVTGVNKASLKGTGIAAATVNFAAPESGQVVPAGSSVSVKVNVTSATAPAPSGTVLFKIDGKPVGAAVDIVSGTASLNIASLSTGTHSLVASYSGDKYHSAASATEKIVGGAATKAAK